MIEIKILTSVKTMKYYLFYLYDINQQTKINVNELKGSFSSVVADQSLCNRNKMIFLLLLLFFSEQSCDKVELPSWLEEKLKNDWTRQQTLLMREDLQRKYRRVKFTGASVIYCFASGVFCKSPALTLNTVRLLQSSL